MFHIYLQNFFTQFIFTANVDNLMLDFFIDLDSTDLRIVGGKKAESVKADDGKITELFSVIEKNISPELVSKTGAIFQFVVKGNLNS